MQPTHTPPRLLAKEDERGKLPPFTPSIHLSRSEGRCVALDGFLSFPSFPFSSLVRWLNGCAPLIPPPHIIWFSEWRDDANNANNATPPEPRRHWNNLYAFRLLVLRIVLSLKPSFRAARVVPTQLWCFVVNSTIRVQSVRSDLA